MGRFDVGINDHGLFDHDLSGFGFRQAPVTGGIAAAPPAMSVRSRNVESIHLA